MCVSEWVTRESHGGNSWHGIELNPFLRLVYFLVLSFVLSFESFDSLRGWPVFITTSHSTTLYRTMFIFFSPQKRQYNREAKKKTPNQKTVNIAMAKVFYYIEMCFVWYWSVLVDTILWIISGWRLFSFFLSSFICHRWIHFGQTMEKSLDKRKIQQQQQHCVHHKFYLCSVGVWIFVRPISDNVWSQMEIYRAFVCVFFTTYVTVVTCMNLSWRIQFKS